MFRDRRRFALVVGLVLLFCSTGVGSGMKPSSAVTPAAGTAGVVTGTITGTVTDHVTHAPIPGTTVQLYSQTGSLLNTATADAAGAYAFTDLAMATYFVRTTGSSTHIDELWDDQTCAPGCAVTGGDPVVIGEATVLSQQIDFALARSSKILGTVTNGAGDPVSGITVRVYNVSGAQVSSTTSDASGAWSTATSKVSAGTYFARTNAGGGYTAQLWQNLPCFPSCTVTTGTPIVVGVEEEKTGINFQLDLGGSITGSVVEAAAASGPSDPVTGGAVAALTETGATAASGSVSGGVYTISGLAPGSYYLRYSPVASGSTGTYLGQLHPGLPCQGSCPPYAGTLVPVTAGATTTDKNFSLTRGGRILGVVTDAATTTPIQNLNVGVYDAGGNFINSARTDVSGAYTLSALPAGNVFVRTLTLENSARVYIDELYAVPQFPIVTVTDGTPVPVVPGVDTTGIDFALELGHTFAGTLKNAVTNANVAGSVEVFDSDGIRIGSVSGSGSYTSMGLPAGSYFARTTNQQGLIDELWDTGPCLGCDPTAGTPIVLPAPAGPQAALTGINFALDPGGRIAGIVRDSAGIAITSSGSVNIFDEGGTIAERLFVSSTTGSYAGLRGLPSGTYFARADFTGYARELFEDLPCGGMGCAETLGTPIAVTSPDTTPGINFSLASCPAMTLAPQMLAVGHTGRSYSQTILAAGGTPPYVYSTASRLPDGLTLDGSSGMLSGLVSATGGWFNFSVSALDANGCSGSRLYQIAVTPGGAFVVSSIDPDSGPTAGGTAVTISGTGFEAGAVVTIGGVGASEVVVVDDSTITAVSGTHAAGTVDVEVTSPGGDVATLAGGFTFFAPPSVTGIDPNTGPAAGGTTVTITGADFVAGATVTIGGEAAVAEVLDSTTIVATAPPLGGGVRPIDPRASTPVDVDVTNPDGQVDTLTNGFSYVPAPTVTSITPASGPQAGGTTITITGGDFHSGATVFVGGAAATSVSMVSATTITARTPAGEPGPADVEVRNPDGQTGVLEDGFAYLAAPGLDVVDPVEGLRTGGTAVTLSGSNFQAGATLFFDGVPATAVIVVDDATITGNIPAHAPGVVDVSVRNPDGQTGVLEDGFTYLDFPPDLIVTAMAGPASAGPGQSISVATTTKNIGKGIAVPSSTGIYLSPDAAWDEGDERLGARDVPNLNAGASSAGAVNVTIPDGTAPGPYFLIAKADSDEAVAEGNETNNASSRPLRVGVNVIVSALTVPTGASPGDTITVRDTTRNLGPGRAPDSTTGFYLSMDQLWDAGDVRLGGRAVPALNSGQNSAGATSVEIPTGTVPGSYYVLGRADDAAVIGEASEADNVKASKAVKLGPDLAVTVVRAPLTGVRGANVTVTDTTRNLGSGGAPTSTTRIFWSEDAVWDDTDMALVDRALPELAAGGTSVGGTAVQIPPGAVAGRTYYLIAVADGTATIAETSETNNAKARGIRVK